MDWRISHWGVKICHQQNFHLRNTTSSFCILKSREIYIFLMKAILLINVSKLPGTLDHRTQFPFSVCALIEPVKKVYKTSSTLIPMYSLKASLTLLPSICARWHGQPEMKILSFFLEKYWSYKVFISYHSVSIIYAEAYTVLPRQAIFVGFFFNRRKKYMLLWHYLHQMSTTCPGNAKLGWVWQCSTR